jgi:hypothetical protein
MDYLKKNKNKKGKEIHYKNNINDRNFFQISQPFFFFLMQSVNLFKIVSSVYKHLKNILRPRLVCRMDIPLGKKNRYLWE